ncbi:MAG: T9SS type A sorting domain-containing protein, partial [Rhodothermales bacterium]
ADTGRPILDFGIEGRIDLTKGLRRPINRFFYGVSSPPLVCNNTVIVGASILDAPVVKEMPPGDIRGFDARTGNVKWIFESVPQGDSEGAETWENESWRHTGNTNVWPPMSCDEELGIVYLPFGTPSNDYYGGHRPGDNLFAESLVAVDVETGEKVWHYQMVHHGIWDYDLPAAPNLVDITVNGKQIKAVAQITKHSFTFVFDRVTGEPVWPIEERPVPQSTVPGERTAATQPFPTRPLPFDRQGITENDLIDFTPSLNQQALTILQRYDHGPLFTPPTQRGTIAVPGVSGSASWSGAAVDPDKGILYVPSMTPPFILRVAPATSNPHYNFSGSFEYGPIGPQNLPLLKPPYGRITAIDLNTGEHLWVSPVGEGPRNHTAIQHLNLPKLGWARRSFPLLTKTLLFVAQEGITLSRGGSPLGWAAEIGSRNHDPNLRAFDPDDGTEWATIRLPGNATGAPISYMAAGQQYIVVPVGGASHPAELVALTLGGRTGTDDEMPLRTALEQNYPNPFNRVTTITFEVSAPTHVELVVRDVLGRRVRTLIDEVKGVGRHQVPLYAEGLPSGMYLYTLQTDTFTQTRKLLLVK